MRVRSETIRVVEYDPHWATLFLRLRERLWPLVSDLAIAIEHVGSTSVPGLAAKPVLDIDIVIRSRQDFPTVTERLASRGYAPRGDLGIADREAFAAPAEEPRHHLYVCSQYSLALRNHMALRDHLRANPSDAAAYSAVKKLLAQRFPDDIDRYVEGKTDFIVSILAKCCFEGDALDLIRKANKPQRD